MTLLFTDPLFLKHETGDHPENPGRLKAITHRLRETGLDRKCTIHDFHPADLDSIRGVHTPEMIELIREASLRGGGRIEADTVVSPASFEVAKAAAGAAMAAVDAVIKGEAATALCLVRPPGHHATATESMGFCLFNNVALAAHHARRVHGLSRILILDWDVHHGNGTQDIFYEDPEIHFMSIHRYGGGFYPGTGAKDETGRGKGLGHTVNVPIRYGTSRKDYLAAYSSALEKLADKAKPELLIISAGFDAHALDPVGSLGLQVEDFEELTKTALAIARTHCSGRIVSCLEGGYNPEVLAESVEAHLRTFLG